MSSKPVKPPFSPDGFAGSNPADGEELEWSPQSADVPEDASDAIARAERAIAALAGELTGLIAAHAEGLARIFAQAKLEGFPDRSLADLFNAAHDLKGQAATLGYPLVSEVCGSLCWLLELPLNEPAVAEGLIADHIDAALDLARQEPEHFSRLSDVDRVAALRKAVSLRLPD